MTDLCRNYVTISGKDEGVQKIKDILINEVDGLFDALIGKTIDITYDVPIDRDVTFMSDYYDPIVKIYFDTIWESPLRFADKVASDYGVNVHTIYYKHGDSRLEFGGQRLLGSMRSNSNSYFMFSLMSLKELYNTDAEIFWEEINSRIWRMVNKDDCDTDSLLNEVSFLSDDEIGKVLQYKDEILFINNLLK
jgi:hypothetical protein